MKAALDFSVSVFVAELLQNHPCVIIPGLGAFIANDIPAKYSSENNEFSPPSRQISFNRRLASNDGLLSNKISKQTGVSFTQANEIISFEVNRFIAKLNNRWDFEGVGYLHSNAEGNVGFYPLSENNLSALGFGLESVFAIPAHQSQPVIIRLNEATVSKSRSPVIRRLSYAAASAAVLALAFVGAYQFSPNQNQALLGFVGHSAPSYTPAYITFNDDVEQVPSFAKAKKISLYDFKEVNESAEGVRLDEDTAKSFAPNMQTSAPISNFNIVVGAFSNTSLATKLAEKLKKEGFSPKLISSKTNDLIVVSAMGFATEDEAFDFLPKVNTLYREAWVKANW